MISHIRKAAIHFCCLLIVGVVNDARGLWVSTGISGAASGSILAALSTLSVSIPPTRAQSIAPISPPTFYPLERTISMNANKFSFGTGTVSESASKSSLRLPKILTD
jgi:hypothetical protein